MNRIFEGFTPGGEIGRRTTGSSWPDRPGSATAYALSHMVEDRGEFVY